MKHTLGTEANRYTVFVNGKYHSHTSNYDWAYQRGIALAKYLGMEFTNTDSNLILDKWVNESGMIIIQKTKNS